MKQFVRRETKTANGEFLTQSAAKYDRERIQLVPAETGLPGLDDHPEPGLSIHGPGDRGAIAVARLNVACYRKLLANELDKDKRKLLLSLWTDEEGKLVSALRKEGKKSVIDDFSQVPIHGCCQSVRENILKLSSGPIFHRSSEQMIQAGASDDIVLLVNGVARRCRHYRDGNRSIASFYMAGETIGWDDKLQGPLTTEAATDTVSLLIKRSMLNSLAARDHQLAEFVLAATKSELRRAQDHSLLIARDANSRLAEFLIDLWTRMEKPKVIKVPMSYTDVAIHLGLALPTLSRTITHFERVGLIKRSSYRTLALRDHKSLTRMVR